METPIDTTIRRSTSDSKQVMVLGFLALPVLAGVLWLLARVLPESIRGAVVCLAIGGFVAAYVFLLNRTLKPREEPVRLWVGAQGVRTAERWIAPAAQIQSAHLCRSAEASSVYGVQAPPWPWTVAITLPSDRFFLTVASTDQGAWILGRLGRAVQVWSHAELPPTGSDRTWRWLGWTAMLLANGALFAVGFLGHRC